MVTVDPRLLSKAQYRCIGPTRGGRVVAVAADPRKQNVFYFGGVAGGVWRSDDGGSTWTHVGLEDSKHIGRITLHPADRNVAFVAAMGHLWGPNEERGLYRTRDSGETWEKVLGVDEHTGAVEPGGAARIDRPDFTRRQPQQPIRQQIVPSF